MTRKDFELLAASLKDTRDELMVPGACLNLPAALDVLDFAVIALANNLRRTNPRFNRDRFLTACGVVV